MVKVGIRWNSDAHLPPATAKPHVDRPDPSVLQYQLVPAADVIQSGPVPAPPSRPRALVVMETVSAVVELAHCVAEGGHLAVTAVKVIGRAGAVNDQGPVLVVVD